MRQVQGWYSETHGEIGFKVIRAGKIEDMRNVEAYLIKYLKPKFNTVHKCGTVETPFPESEFESVEAESPKAKGKGTKRRRGFRREKRSNDFFNSFEISNSWILSRRKIKKRDIKIELYKSSYQESYDNIKNPKPICIYQEKYYGLLSKFLCGRGTNLSYLLLVHKDHSKVRFPEYDLMKVITTCMPTEKAKTPLRKLKFFMDLVGLPHLRKQVTFWRYSYEREFLYETWRNILKNSHPKVCEFLKNSVRVQQILIPPRMRELNHQGIHEAKRAIILTMTRLTLVLFLEAPQT